MYLRDEIHKQHIFLLYSHRYRKPRKENGIPAPSSQSSLTFAISRLGLREGLSPRCRWVSEQAREGEEWKLMFWREGRGVCARKLSNSQAQKAVGVKASFEVGKAVRPTPKKSRWEPTWGVDGNSRRLGARDAHKAVRAEDQGGLVVG